MAGGKTCTESYNTKVGSNIVVPLHHLEAVISKCSFRTRKIVKMMTLVEDPMAIGLDVWKHEKTSDKKRTGHKYKVFILGNSCFEDSERTVLKTLVPKRT